MSQRLITNTISNSVFHIAGIALGFVTIPVLIENLGDAEYGLILLVTALVGYFDVFGAGVPAGSVKYIAEFEAKGQRNKVCEVINTSFVFYLLVGAVIAGLLACAAYWGLTDHFLETDQELSKEAETMFYVAALIALIMWPAKSYTTALSGLQEFHRANVIQLSMRVLTQLAVIVIALAGGTLLQVFVTQQGLRLVNYGLHYRLFKKVFPEYRFRLHQFSIATLKLIFGLSVFVLLSQIAGMLVYQTDKLIIGAMLPVAMLSVYAVVFKPGELIRMVSSLFNSAVMPAISEFEQNKEGKEVESFIYSASRYNNAVVAPFAIITIYLSEPFIRLWVGDRFVEWAWIAQVAAAFMIPWTSNAMVGRICFGLNKANRLTYIAIASAVANVALSIYLVEFYGVAGVILGTVVTGTFSVGLQYFLVFPQIGLSKSRYFRCCFVGAQWPHWILGCALIPAWPYIQSIDSWFAFIGLGCLLSAIFFPIAWFHGVEAEHRRTIIDWIQRRIG